MKDFVNSAWFKRMASVALAAGLYLLASKFPAYAAALASLAAMVPSGLSAKDKDPES